MTQWLIRTFIKNPDDVHNEKVRLAYGNLSSITGIVCNILLFLVKFAIGTISGAVAVTGDAFNNLTDAMSCLISLIGYRFAARPADRDHPFGHGRLEYVFSQIIAVMIFFVGGNLLITGIRHIIHPEEQIFHPVIFTVLLLTILAKLWLSRFNRTLGKKIDSIAMLASAEDSRNDVLATGIAAVSMLLAGFVGNLPFDGVAAVLVALYILWSGYGIAGDILSRMLGRPADRELIEKITAQLKEHPEILSVHDVIIHDYGAGRMMGSAHIEMDQEMRFIDAHEVADRAESEIRRKHRVDMTLHMDPVDLKDPRRAAYENALMDILKDEDPRITIHDLRLKKEGETEILACEILLPFDTDKEAVKQKVKQKLSEIYPELMTKIHFEHGYAGENE